MKVLVADKFPEIYLQQLRELDCEVTYSPKLDEKELPDAAKYADILVVRSTNVTAETISKSESLNLIVRAGAGVNNVDINTANKRGIYVANCPGKNSIAVAELTIGLMIALDRRIPDNVMDFKKGIWNKAEYSHAEGLRGKNLILIGVGNIGKEVAKRAAALGMHVYGKDIIQIEDLPLTYITDLDKILPIADVISIHLPLNKETEGLFSKKLLGLVKHGAIFINTSRAEIVDENALIEAVKLKKLRVGMDVFLDEPSGKDGTVKSPLQDLDNVYITHHIGASTEQAQNAIAEETVNIIRNFLKTGLVDHWVNRAKRTEAQFQLIVKHYDRPGVLASVFNILREGKINIEEVENVIFDGGQVACCTMKLNKKATSAMLELIRGNDEVIHVSLVKI
jgi:D-3-phosphoglycerate dehydrogenase